MHPTHIVVHTGNGTTWTTPEGQRHPFASLEQAQAAADEYNRRVVPRYRCHAVYACTLAAPAPADVGAYTIESAVAGTRQHETAGLAQGSATLRTLADNLEELQPGEYVTVTRLAGDQS